MVWVHTHRAMITTIESLTTVQRKALMAATHCMRSTPTKAMKVIFGLPPIDLFLQEVAMKTWLRIQPLLRSNWNGVGHQMRWEKDLEKIQTISMPRDDITPVPNWTHFEEVHSTNPM